MRSSLILMFLVMLGSSSSTSAKNDVGFSIKIVHRDSVMSHMYNPNETTEERTSRLVRISYARWASIHNALNSATVRLHDGEVFEGLYFLYFYIHNTSFMQSATLDTGSQMTWILCEPTRPIHNTYFPIFRSIDSPTYRQVNCDDPNCVLDRSNSNTCYEETNDCIYSVEYLLGIDSYGYLSTDNFVFDDIKSEGHVIMESVVFGCSGVVKYRLIETENVDPFFMGVVGLGHESILAKRLKKFSYCLAPSINGEGDSYLAMGADAQLTGGKAKIQELAGKYAISLRSIKVGGEDITFPAVKAVIDSGSSLTFLHPDIYEKVVQVIDSLLLQKYDYTKPFLSREPNVAYYLGDFEALKTRFPEVVVSFGSGSAKLLVQPHSLFMRVGVRLSKDFFSLSIRSTDSMPGIDRLKGLDPFALIGSRLQFDNNLGFDLSEGNIYMSSRGC